MIRLLIITTGIIAFTACKKQNLNGLAFPSEPLLEYEFENYDAGSNSVPDTYTVDAKDRTLIGLDSKNSLTGETHQIYGVYIGDISSISSDTVILYCHGQSKHMDAYWPRATLLANIIEKHQYGVLMIDYRGYGKSEGTPTELGLYEDVDAAIDWLISQGAIAQQTFYYGYSLGCIPVIDRAAYRHDFKPAKIMIESPLASVENLAQTSTIINVDPNFITSLKFENAEKMKDITMPLFWIHGVEDDYIAIGNGELIYQNHKGGYNEAHRIAGANHGDIPKIMGYDNYINSLAAFILH